MVRDKDHESPPKQINFRRNSLLIKSFLARYQTIFLGHYKKIGHQEKYCRSYGENYYERGSNQTSRYKFVENGIRDIHGFNNRNKK